jgi:hypothetical protein
MSFSEGVELKEYSIGEQDYYDEKLAKQVIKAIIGLFGRFSYSKWITGSVIFSDNHVDFVSLSWAQFRKSFSHSERLFLEHFTETDLKIPPTTKTSTSSLGFIIDSIVFGPTLRLKVIHEAEGMQDDVVINTPHIPTDSWNPAYIPYEEVIKIARSKLSVYTSVLSNWLSDIYDYRSISRISLKQDLSKLDGTRLLLEYTFNKLEYQTREYNDPNRNYYMNLGKKKLYEFFFLHKIHSSEFQDFLKGDIDRYRIVLFDDPNIPKIFHSVLFDGSDISYWKSNNLDLTFSRSFRVSSRDTRDINVHTVVNNLKEPISELGRVLKETADLYGNPEEGNAKKLYLVPLNLHKLGFGQSATTYQYTVPAKDSIMIDGNYWDCWELDGTSKTGLATFGSENYKHVLRALIEGKLHIFVFSYDIESGQKEYVGNFGILNGALSIDQLIFTTSRHFKVFSSLSSHDDTFYRSIGLIMEMFARFSLPLAPQTKGSEAQYDFLF